MHSTRNTSSKSPSRPAFWRWAGLFLAAGILALAFYGLAHNLKDLSRQQIENAVHNMPATRLWSCGLLTIASFLALGGYDSIATRVVAYRKISASRAWYVGAIANAISNTLGFHALTASAVRYRLLARSGLTSSEVAGITALSWTAIAAGFASTFSLAMITSPDAASWQRIAGLALLAIMLATAFGLGDGRRISLVGYILVFPSGKVALAQMALGTVEMGGAIGALYIMLPDAAATPLPAFCAIYVGAVLLGIASHMPGGVGVFEATILTLAVPADRADVLAALLMYRILYNLCPFALAVTLFAGEEIRAAISLRAGRRR